MSDANDLPRDLINAFVDGELSADDRARLLEAAEGHAELSERICQLRMTKDMLRVAYQDPPGSAGPKETRRRRAAWIARAVAAALLLSLGGGTGWYANSAFGPSGENPIFSAQALRVDPARSDYRHVLLHIPTADPRRVDAALNGAEHLLATSEREHKSITVEVIFNSEGIQILRADASPYVARIRSLAARYDNISFLACSRSIERLRMKGVKVHLIKEAQVVPEALDTIVTKLEEGWVYIRA